MRRIPVRRRLAGMATWYPLILLLHLSCAIVFIGAVAFEVLVLESLHRQFEPGVMARIEGGDGAGAALHAVRGRPAVPQRFRTVRHPLRRLRLHRFALRLAAVGEGGAGVRRAGGVRHRGARGDAWDNGSLQVPAHPPRRAVPDGRHRGARQADVLLSRCNARPPPSLPRSHAMSQVTFHGNPVRVDGRFPVAGEQARPFTLVGKDLADVSLSAFKGKRKLLNIFPSVDTGVCATVLPRFTELAYTPETT